MVNKQLLTTFSRFLASAVALFALASCKQAVPELQNLRALSGLTLDQNSVAVAHKLDPSFVVTGTCNSQFSSLEISLDNGSTWSPVSAVAHQATVDCQASGKFRLDFTTGLPTTLSDSPNLQLLFRGVSDMGYSDIRALSILQKQAGSMILVGAHSTTNGTNTARLTGRVGGSASSHAITSGFKLTGSVRSQ